MPLLSFDCARSVAGVALADALGQVTTRSAAAGQAQASDLLPMAEQLLEGAGQSWSSLGGLVLVHGPGSFTGLRVAAGLVQGLALARDLPVALVSAFEALAFIGPGDGRPRPCAVALDARLGEWFEGEIAWTESGLPTLHGDPRIVQQPMREAWVDPEQAKSASLAEAALALVLARMGQAGGQQWAQAADAQPLYVRDRVAQTIEARRLQAALRLEPMRREDLASVMVIEQQAYPFPWTSGNFRDSFEAGYALRRLIDQDAMVGYCVWMEVADEAHLLNLTIAPARQRRGLGQWMLKELVSVWQSQGLRRCLLEVRPSNLPALGLYRRNGFEEIGLRRGYYPNGASGREDALVLSRAL